MWIALNFNSKSKIREIFAGGPRYRNWTRLVSWLGVPLSDGHTEKFFFSVSGIFSRKAESVTLLVFECTVNPQILMEIVQAIFKKTEILNFFLCELSLILGVRGKLKKGSRYLQDNPIYPIWTRSVNWFRLYVRRPSHKQTDRQTDIFSKTHF